MTQLDTNLAALPDTCYATLPTTGELIIIASGESGYHPVSGYSETDALPFSKQADMLNDRMGVTQEQRMAMEMGSMFGWHVPGAHPDKYRVKVLAKKLREVTGAAVLADEALRMESAGATFEEIKERFKAILEAARPDLAAKADA